MGRTESVARSLRSASPIVERGVELSRIDRLLGEAAGGDGQLLVIEGPTGIGKTRLLDEARTRASERGLEVLRAGGGELERDYPFAVILALLETRFASDSPAERRHLFRGRAALAAPLLTVTDDDAWPTKTTDEFALMHGLYWCLVNLTEE